MIINIKNVVKALIIGVCAAGNEPMTQKCKADATDPNSLFKECTSFNILSLS